MVDDLDLDGSPLVDGWVWSMRWFGVVKMSASKYSRLLRLGDSPTYELTIGDPLSAQVDNLMRRYLAREDRSFCGFEFIVDGEVRLVKEHDMPTNEVVFPRRTAMSLKDFCMFTERSSLTPNRVGSVDYVGMQMLMAKLGKTVCYYVVYSDADRRFRDIVAVSINRETVAYLSSL